MMGERTSIERRITEAQQRWPALVFKRKNTDEASADGCPFCSMVDDDGFLVFSDGGYWCRKCSQQGWIDEEEAQPLSREELLELRVRRLERKQLEHDRRLTKLEQLQQSRPDLRYYRSLTESAMEYWFSEGIYTEAIEKFRLGYCDACPTYTQSPSYTIPVYSYGGDLVNVRHRLIKPNGTGKYRPEMGGLGTSLYHADALREPQKRIIIAEGEKKSIVLSQHGFPAVGLMGKSFKWKRPWFDWFRDHGRIIIALDPDALESAWRLGEVFTREGFDNVSVARFPVKPDDAIVKHGAQAGDVEGILRNAKRVRG